MKQFKDLNIMSDFMFGVIMRNEKYCKPLLECILNIHIRKLVYVNDQETIQPPVPGSRSIRLDVYVEDDENTVYNIEVQTYEEKNIGKRMRYYQGLIDVRCINKGDDYSKLKKSYVIFIADRDLFGAGQYIYTFRYTCQEDSNIILNDDAIKIVVNTKGYVGEISDELKALIEYMDKGIVTSEYTRELDNEVEAVKNDEKARREYMMLVEAYARNRTIGAHITKVELIRDAVEEFTPTQLARHFKVKEDNCKAIIEMVREHPELSDEDIALRIDWDD